MGWTKREFVTAAFEEIGLASFAFDPASAEMLSAGRRLDAMMAQWNARGIRIGYPLVNPTAIDLDTQTSCPDSATEAIITNLACRIAPGFGVTVMPETKATARQGFSTLQAQTATPMEMQFPSTLPVGAGNKALGGNPSPFFPEPTEPLDAGPDDILSFE